jgi:hypothetical protein
MIERGGKLRLVPVQDAKMGILGPALEEHISPEAHTIYTDESAAYAIYPLRHFDAEHKTIMYSCACHPCCRSGCDKAPGPLLQ